ncbi:hypothetical protein CKAH01_11287 [Colletotrichum kahawae]|uniref:Alginate lyase domain-containing protein n=1 Tax=Colletotrichum kahawae TaxID=34407 RepID=A0AAD9YTJ2_COLKA|nr:hypothetical protein CKAH01_11287 [Colletotrichum kahawae]
MVPASTSLNAVSTNLSLTPFLLPLKTELSSSKPFLSDNAADERSHIASLENKQATASAPSGTPAVFLAEPTASDPVLAPASFKHPGLLHTDDDFARIRAKVNAGKEPWNTAWNKMLQSSYASSSYQPSPTSVVYRGSDGTHAENYGQLYRDVAAAYVLAVRWGISQDAEYGNAAVRIMNAWSSNLTTVSGNVDLYLAAGIYGYEFAQAGEIMRDFEGNGQINEAVPYTFWYDNQVLGQTMESGRDQGHNTLNIALLGVIAQIAYNQGNDLFSYNGSIILAASEYVARYKL